VLALGIVAAIGASCLYNTSIALQALEVRDVPHEHSLRISLIGKLVRNRKWLGATALGLLGWPLEIVALLLAPLTVVQPCLVSGLIVLLWLGATRLGETPGKQEFVAVAAIVVGVAGVAWAAPDRTTDHAGTVAIAIALGLVAIPIAAPYVMRRRTSALGLLVVLSAGFGYAWTAIASKLLTDELAAGTLLIAVAWLATALASEALALLSEMSALQHRPATHVAPVMFAVQVLAPVILAPLIFEEKWSTTPLDGAVLVAFIGVALAGAMLLASSRVVGAVIESAHAGD
jgi:drug/metabolite transporter (DMT)-like permease